MKAVEIQRDQRPHLSNRRAVFLIDICVAMSLTLVLIALAISLVNDWRQIKKSQQMVIQTDQVRAHFAQWRAGQPVNLPAGWSLEEMPQQVVGNNPIIPVKITTATGTEWLSLRTVTQQEAGGSNEP